MDTVFDPALDDSQFAGLIGPKAKSIVRRQPTISELVCRLMSSLVPAVQNEATGGMAGYIMEYNGAARDLDFQHLQLASGTDMNESHGDVGDLAKTSAKEAGKRKATFEDAFTDFEFDDDFDLDETELEALDQLQAPEKLANGNYKCNHQCKDKTKYSISTQSPLTVIDADIYVAKKEKLLAKRKPGRRDLSQESPLSPHLQKSSKLERRVGQLIAHRFLRGTQC